MWSVTGLLDRRRGFWPAVFQFPHEPSTWWSTTTGFSLILLPYFLVAFESVCHISKSCCERGIDHCLKFVTCIFLKDVLWSELGFLYILVFRLQNVLSLALEMGFQLRTAVGITFQLGVRAKTINFVELELKGEKKQDCSYFLCEICTAQAKFQLTKFLF